MDTLMIGLAVGAVFLGLGIIFVAYTGDTETEVEAPAPIVEEPEETVEEEQGIPEEELPIVTAQEKNENGEWVVYIRDYYYDPGKIYVSKGETVRWVNVGEKNHYVFSYRGIRVLDSKEIKPNEEWTYTFNEEPGDYEYLSPLWPEMYGKVIIEE